MNPGIAVYICIEAMVTAYVVYLFFQMGRNRVERYAAMRKQFSSILSFMDSSKVCYGLAAAMGVFLVFRVAEQLSRHGAF